MSTGYADRWITCSQDGLSIRGYYVPWGTKLIPYRSIRSMERVRVGAVTGRARIWGTANPRYWASLDPQRPRKRTALILDLGRAVKPFLTPDDPAALEAAIREHTTLPPTTERAGRGPII